MSKIKYISLCTAMLLCMILFTSCGGEATVTGQDNRREEGKESFAEQENRQIVSMAAGSASGMTGKTLRENLA